MFSEAANHFYKAAKQVRSKIMSQLAVMKFTWITLYILKNSHCSERSEILSSLQKSNKNGLAEEEVASPGQSCKQCFFLSEKRNFEYSTALLKKVLNHLKRKWIRIAIHINNININNNVKFRKAING